MFLSKREQVMEWKINIEIMFVLKANYYICHIEGPMFPNSNEEKRGPS